MQKAIEDGFTASGFNGAAVVLDPRNGEVLGFTSRPAYDPNAFAGGIDRATWASLNTDDLKPLQNRALQGRYSPGLDLQDGGRPGRARGRRHHAGFHACHCAGGATFYGRTFACWKKGGHGTVDLRHAIEQSCDVYFYTVGNMLGVDRINKWATLLGLGVKIEHRSAERVAGARALDGVEGDAEERRSGTPARRFRSPSARGRCR